MNINIKESPAVILMKVSCLLLSRMKYENIIHSITKIFLPAETRDSNLVLSVGGEKPNKFAARGRTNSLQVNPFINFII